MSDEVRYVCMDEAFVERFAGGVVEKLIATYGWPTTESGEPAFDKLTVKTHLIQLVELAQQTVVAYKNGNSAPHEEQLPAPCQPNTPSPH